MLSLITCLLLPFGMLLLGYSIFIYDQRLSALKAKEVRKAQIRAKLWPYGHPGCALLCDS